MTVLTRWRWAAVLLVAVGLALLSATGVYLWGQSDPAEVHAVRWRRGQNITVAVRPRLPGTFVLALNVREPEGMFAAALKGRDTVLGAIFRHANARDSVAHSAVDVGWDVQLQGRLVAHGIARGNNATSFGSHRASRELGRFQAPNRGLYRVTFRVLSESSVLAALDPRLSIGRLPDSDPEGIWLVSIAGFVLGSLLVGLGALVAWAK